MSLPFLPFQDLQPQAHGLTDASSMAALVGRIGILTAPLTPATARDILDDVEQFDLEGALNLLERWIVVDHLAVDIVAVNSLGGSTSAVKSFQYAPSGFERFKRSPEEHAAAREHAFIQHLMQHLSPPGDESPLSRIAVDLGLVFTLMPLDVFTRCMRVVARTAKALEEAHPDVKWRTFGFGVEKTYGEALVAYYQEWPLLARSHLGVERTLVYYEAAATARIPLVLHPSRYGEAQAINAGCCDAYSLVKATLRTAFEEPIRAQLKTLGHTYSVPLPPLCMKVVETAGANRISIIRAAQQLKESNDAASFRKWLAEIQQALAQGTTTGRMEALGLLAELRRVATLWATHLDPTVGVTHKRRELRFSWVPRIGGLLDLLDRPTVRDPILNQKGYLTFMSQWFSQS